MLHKFKTLSGALALGILISQSSFANSEITGLWQTVDKDSGEAKSQVRIVENSGVFNGKIEKLLIEPKHPNCVKCKGDLKDHPLLGLPIIQSLSHDKDNVYADGRIINPENGKDYKLKATLVDNNTLQIRGSIGPIGKTQTWTRVE